MLSRYLRPGLSLLFAMTLLLGILYPMIVTGVGKFVFPTQADGSLIRSGTTVVGSSLIGQTFSEPKYFWGRPSATSPYSNNASASSGSNLGPLNPALIDKVNANAKALREADPQNKSAIPVDLVTASGSGLDPEISVAAAHYQAGRVARARGLDIAIVNSLINEHTQGPLLGILGESRINVLELNLALDQRH